MITLAPLQNEEEVQALYRQAGLPFHETSKCVTANDGETVLGFCLFDMDEKAITVRYLTPETDLPLADGILRSTLHVAAERSIMNAFYADKLSEDMLEKLCFIQEKEKKSLAIDKLFQSCCGKEKGC